MPTSEETKLERLDLLENKVSQAARAVETLTARCRELTKINEGLKKEMADLTGLNANLSKEIEELKAQQLSGSAKIESRKVLNKIDKMIEKFGELQV